jgi:hypothetical protein
LVPVIILVGLFLRCPEDECQAGHLANNEEDRFRLLGAVEVNLFAVVRYECPNGHRDCTVGLAPPMCDGSFPEPVRYRLFTAGYLAFLTRLFRRANVM